MRRFLGWVGGAVGGITAYRLLRRQRAAQLPAEPDPSLEGDTRAEELRAKLAETREAEPTLPLAEEQPAEPGPEEGSSESEPESPEDRRRRVYEEGRAALDEMRPEAEAES
jgi:hypothetical protein